jgi:hypothetical protein
MSFLWEEGVIRAALHHEWAGTRMNQVDFPQEELIFFRPQC